MDRLVNVLSPTISAFLHEAIGYKDVRRYCTRVGAILMVVLNDDQSPFSLEVDTVTFGSGPKRFSPS